MNVKEKNEQLVLKCFERVPLLTQKGLMELSGLARTTAYDALVRLQLKNKVFRATYRRREKRKHQGRNRVYWSTKTEFT